MAKHEEEEGVEVENPILKGCIFVIMGVALMALCAIANSGIGP